MVEIVKPEATNLVSMSDRHEVNDHPHVAHIPVIDLSLLSSPPCLSSEQGLAELEKLRQAVSTWGYFQAIGHGISSSFLSRLCDVTKQFFALPIKEKQKYAQGESNHHLGYNEERDLSDKQIRDYCDRLLLSLLPEQTRKLEFWPDKPSEFRVVLNEYSEKLKVIVGSVLRAMARSLRLEEDCFLKQYRGKEFMAVRLNYYPLCPIQDSVLGLRAHSDGSGISVLLRDPVTGLQVFKDEKWYDVPIVPDALLINAGDQIEIMSNGIFRSPFHRVLASSKKEMISVAAFHLPSAELEIEPVPELMDESRPQKYRKVKNYNALVMECSQKGTKPLDVIKI